MNDRTSILTIPAGVPFARTLARSLLDRAQEQDHPLSETRILLPTRRACRVLQGAFLEENGGKPLLLPRLQTLGDVDEEDLSLSVLGAQGDDALLNLPPSMPPLRRQFLLARLISAVPDFQQDHDHALNLAGALGRFMDHIYTENLDLADLKTLVPEDFAAHWQITLDFLEILSIQWPKILAEEGLIDGADRRNRLILGLETLWRTDPPDFPVIAAGSTGSIPAVARLLSTIARLPQGEVILPGLDTDMDAQSWEALDESHPQYGLKQLLERMETPRESVKVFMADFPIQSARRRLASEMMRPAETTARWRSLGEKQAGGEESKEGALFSKALEDLSLFECETAGEEAQVIALLLRETLETPGETAALITPDRALARRVTAACRRWGISIDDSAGKPLGESETGSFLRLIAEACSLDFAPVALLALLKHPLCTGGWNSQDWRKATQILERLALRGFILGHGLAGATTRLQAHNDADALQALALLNTFKKIVLPLSEQKERSINEFIKIHIRVAEALASTPDHSGEEGIWTKNEGKSITSLLISLMDHGALIPSVTLSAYTRILDHFLKNETVRPAYGMHPRLVILGQLEARMVEADLVILGGLNEGVWPTDPGHDPWMSRPMRRNFGLPAPERSTGLSAHDFVQGFCAPRTVLTRARRAGGVPTVPSRWLQRLKTVLDVAGTKPDTLGKRPYLAWVKTLDRAEEVRPRPRPAPVPPVGARPRRLSATQVDTWLKDPYAIYARHILRLRPLDPLEQPPDAALKGTILHAILERFVRTYPTDIPDHAAEILSAFAQEALQAHGDENAPFWNFWHPRFARIADWVVKHEYNWRKMANPLKIETNGLIHLNAPGGVFTITARADRIDLVPGGYALIDYKSGGSFTRKGLETGQTPQLPLEALIATEGGFEDLPARAVAWMGYWILTGATTAGEVVYQEEGLRETISQTREGLSALIAAFDEETTPYYSLPDEENLSRYNDYEHLERVAEWKS